MNENDSTKYNKTRKIGHELFLVEQPMKDFNIKKLRGLGITTHTLKQSIADLPLKDNLIFLF